MAKKANGRSGLDSTIWRVCDVLRRSNCAGAMQYVPERTRILFLRILDETERREGEMAKAVGSAFRHSLASPYRWQDWAAPDAPEAADQDDGDAVPAGAGQFNPEGLEGFSIQAT